MKNYIRISKLAKDLGVSKQTLWNWKCKERICFVKPYDNNFNYVTQEEYDRLLGIKRDFEEKVIIYARVSSPVNKNNLDSQVERMINYSNARGYKIHKIVREFGSGINDRRPKLEKLLRDGDFTRIVVEHKDRLTRLGFNYLQILCDLLGKKIEVVNEVTDDKEDIIQDFVSIITSFCAKIYGHRRSKRNTEKLIEKLRENKENDQII